MKANYPILKIKNPKGKQNIIKLNNLVDSQTEDICINIGRDENNHIVLPDPQKNISRLHCSIQYKKGRWWLVDEDSTNGTFLRHKKKQTEIEVSSEEIFPLRDEDKIFILGEFNTLDKPVFWQFKFIDFEDTHQINKPKRHHPQPAIGIEYSLSQQKLFRITSNGLDEIFLQGHELSFIDYMSRKNYENNGRPVICKYNKLIEAIWSEENFGIDNLDIHHLAWRIRHKIESDSGESQFLKTVRGKGYRLEVKVID